MPARDCVLPLKDASGPAVGSVARQPKRVNPLNRIRRVLLEIYSAEQSNRVFGYEPPTARIVITMPAVVQPRLFIQVLTLEPDRVPEPGLPPCLRENAVLQRDIARARCERNGARSLECSTRCQGRHFFCSSGIAGNHTSEFVFRPGSAYFEQNTAIRAIWPSFEAFGRSADHYAGKCDSLIEFWQIHGRVTRLYVALV